MLWILEIDLENITDRWTGAITLTSKFVFDPSKFGVWQRLTHRLFVQIIHHCTIHIVTHQVRQWFRTNTCTCYYPARYLSEHWLRPPRIPRSMNITISISMSNSNLTRVCFSMTFYVKPGNARYNNARDRDRDALLLRKFSKISANNKTSVFKYRSLYSPSVRRIAARRSRERNRSRILYCLSTNWKIIRGGKHPVIFWHSQCTKRHLLVLVIQILHLIILKIRNVQFLIYNF